MSLLIDTRSPIIVQGITGRYGEFFARRMIEYGTPIVGGVTPGKGGEWFLGKPVFDTMARAIEATGAQTSIIAVPPPYASDAMFEAIDSGIRTIVCMTEHVPVVDALRVKRYAQMKQVTLFGPASAGVLIPGKSLLGMIPIEGAIPGSIGIVTRSGTMLYELGRLLTHHKLGQSAHVCLGSDPVVGVSLQEMLERFEADPDTERIVMALDADRAEGFGITDFVLQEMTKPIIAVIVGRTVPLDALLTTGASYLTNIAIAPEELAEVLSGAGIRVVDHAGAVVQALLSDE